MASHKNRIDRLDALLRRIPLHGNSMDCPSAATLLARLARQYVDHASDTARHRAIQRDLGELIGEGRIEAVNPGGKPLRYRRVRIKTDHHIREYLRRTIRDLSDNVLSLSELEAIWPQLRDPEDGLGLGEDKLYILSDTQRLLPAAIQRDVLTKVLEALSKSQTLQISYRDKVGKYTQPTLHPQALLQRGPRLYLFALKNDEEAVRTYALHRITRADASCEAARSARGFDLKTVIASGEADFGKGENIELHLRVRGYVADLLRECPLSANQRILEEDENSNFEACIHATVPATGQLLRWVLGFGDNVEVLGPDEFRHAIQVQASKMAETYRKKPGHQTT